MSQPDKTQKQLDLDTQVLSDFIYGLNISRRHLATYPPEHPMIASSCQQVMALFDELFQFRETLTLGIAKDALLFEHTWLDKKNPVYRDFALALSKLGIAAVHFHRNPTAAELTRFNQLLRYDRQKIAASGGLESLLAEMQIEHIELREVDYSSFHTTDEETLTLDTQTLPLWQDFLDGLLDNTLAPDATENQRLEKLDPKIVASILNRKFSDAKQRGDQNYDQVISAFVGKLQNQDRHSQLGKQYGQLVNQLNPELKRQFLNSTFRNLNTDQANSQKVLESFPSDLVLATLEEVNQKQLNISGTLLNLLGTLSDHQQQDARQSLTAGDAGEQKDDQEQQLRTIFQEENTEKFTPEAYQRALNSIVSLEQEIQLQEEEVAELRQSLTAVSIERHSSAIIFRLLADQAESTNYPGLQHNLIDLAHYFLEVGDFKGLRELHGHLIAFLRKYPQAPPEHTELLLATLTAPEFQQEVLDNLQRWGEEKQKEICAYIKLAGKTFATSLIERLGSEESRTLRRFYLSTLASMGSSAHPAIYTALHDERWFLVRNLIAVLRLQKEPIDLQQILFLRDHPHPRVNQEVLNLLFQNDPEQAEQLVLKQLQSSDPKLLQHAVQLAEHSKDRQVVDKLLELLTTTRLNSETLPLKLQIIKSLGAIGDAAALPALGSLLFSGKLFSSSSQQQLQKEILNQLERYPFAAVKELLQKLVLMRRGELSRLATEKLRQRFRSSA